MENNYLVPAGIAQKLCETGVEKARYTAAKQFALGIMAGIFVALACQGTNLAVHTIDSAGLAKTIAGTLFSTALILVVIAGGELFTGNCLMIMACAKRRITTLSMLRSWAVVYLSNMAGSLLVVFLVIYSGQFDLSAGALGAYTVKTAVYKTGLGFTKALIMGILCNILVCAAVWIAAAAKDITGKILAIFFPIWLFVTSGFEHSVANMYYIPAGILAKSNPRWLALSIEAGVSEAQIQSLNIQSFLIGNLLPVTLGNIIGGSVIIGLMYCFIYLRNENPVK